MCRAISEFNATLMSASKGQRGAELRIDLGVNAAEMEQVGALKQSNTSTYEEQRSGGQKA
jgi:hypothetical protein